MGYTIGMPSLKLSNVQGKNSKHCGNFAKVAKEALSERQGLDMDINPALAEQNIYIGFSSAEELIKYSQQHIDELNKWRAEHGKRACDKRKIREDTVVMCATVIKPPAEMMSQLSAEQQQQFLNDSLDIFKKFVGADNIKTAAFHFDERVPHLHIFWEPMKGEHRICAKDMHNLQFFGKLNREMPKQLRAKGWTMIDDCQAYDKEEEEQKRLEMGEEQYREYRKALKANRGKDSRQFKHEVEQEITEKQKELAELEQALTAIEPDTKETKKVMKGLFEVKKTPEELEHDKAIAGAKLILRREKEVEQREIAVKKRENECAEKAKSLEKAVENSYSEGYEVGFAQGEKHGKQQQKTADNAEIEKLKEENEKLKSETQRLTANDDLLERHLRKRLKYGIHDAIEIEKEFEKEQEL